MCSSRLRNLQEGNDEKIESDNIKKIFLLHESVDMEKFKRGKLFFQKNITSCVTAMMCSLVCGLSIINLLEPLVFTKKSDTPRKSVSRYLQTLFHVVKWHYGNIFDVDSDAYKSLSSVLEMHESVSSDMARDKGGKLYISQYDMSLVQCGFIGAIIMYPGKFGISCSTEDLDDFIYFWGWIGYMLGMTEKNNICSDGYQSAFATCKDIEQFILVPALKSPPPDFKPMADAFMGGVSLLTHFSLFTTGSVIGFSFDSMEEDRLPHTFGDKIRIWFQKTVMLLLRYCSPFQNFMNKTFEKLYGCNKIT